MSKAPARAGESRDELDRRAEIVAEAQAEIDRRLAQLDAEQARLQTERAEFERERAMLRAELEEAREQARGAAEAMIELESRRAEEAAELHDARRELAALEREDVPAGAAERMELLDRELADAHKVIRSMQQTRVWRIGGAWWRFRDRLLGRRN